MNKTIKSFIDSVIRENKELDDDGYHLFVDGLDKNTREESISVLLNNDDVTKERLLERLQELIDERIDRVYAQDQYECGQRPYVDEQTGAINWR